MSMFSRDSSCAMRAEQRSGRLLSDESSMVLMFQHAMFSRVVDALSSRVVIVKGVRSFFFTEFRPSEKMPVDCGKPTGYERDELCLGHLF